MSLVILGAGGHAREVHDIAEALEVDVVGFIADAAPDLKVLEGRGPWLGRLSDMAQMDPCDYVVAIGSGAARKQASIMADSAGFRAVCLVHPMAVIGRHGVALCEGAVVGPFAVVTTDVQIGRHTHLNRSAQVGHDSVLGDFVTMHPGSIASGNVNLGEGVTMGTLACARPGISVGAWSEVGAGAAVVSDVGAGVRVGGVPARSL